MKFVSITSILTLIFICYLGNTIWTLIEMFTAPSCRKNEYCISSYLSSRPVQHLVMYTSVSSVPSSASVKKIHSVPKFDYLTSQEFELEIDVGSVRRKNSTLYLYVGLLDESQVRLNYDTVREAFSRLPLVTHMYPQAATFNLLNQKDGSEEKVKTPGEQKPIPHINSFVEFIIMTDDLRTTYAKMPPEFHNFLRVVNSKFVPMIQHNILKSRLKNLKPLERSRHVNVTISYSPASFGMFRLLSHIQLSFRHLYSLGFGEKDVDDVKGIFADTNLYLLCATIVIASCHLLFDFLAFKNDISFWHRKKSMVGLSTRTVLWRGFSTCVIFFYLLDENTSLIVLVPAFISSIIELWKVKKVLRVTVSWRRCVPRVAVAPSETRAEQRTRAVDAEAMRYLSYLLYPLCIAGAAYSLLYEPHKSWYSWSLHSLVNGVYAFGFLFMLPQLFVNYRLRSVAALPWRAFMYKAFNTFIDDVFAFIITMPTAHRVACFRDDVVFLVYLYQRWLYPVDASRTDDALTMDEEPSEEKPKNE